MKSIRTASRAMGGAKALLYTIVGVGAVLVGEGSTMGFLGGGTKSAAMWDNPNYGSH